MFQCYSYKSSHVILLCVLVVGISTNAYSLYTPDNNVVFKSMEFISVIAHDTNGNQHNKLDVSVTYDDNNIFILLLNKSEKEVFVMGDLSILYKESNILRNSSLSLMANRKTLVKVNLSKKDYQYIISEENLLKEKQIVDFNEADSMHDVNWRVTFNKKIIKGVSD